MFAIVFSSYILFSFLFFFASGQALPLPRQPARAARLCHRPRYAFSLMLLFLLQRRYADMICCYILLFITFFDIDMLLPSILFASSRC